MSDLKPAELRIPSAFRAEGERVMASTILDEPRNITIVKGAPRTMPWPVVYHIKIERPMAVWFGYSTGKRLAQEQRRGWRTKRRALELRPLSDKVVYPRRMVDVVPVKKGRPK